MKKLLALLVLAVAVPVHAEVTFTFDDGVWIMPLGKHGLFSDKAYDISEIQDVRLIILQNI
jgi:hypothetical protein